LGNSRLLFQKIPVDETSGEENKFLITPDYAQTFHNNIQANLPRQAGLITSPMEITDISFDRDSVDRNKVNEATMQYWSDAGISQLLFSSNGKTTGASLAKAIQADEAKVFIILYSIERWINKYLLRFAGGNNFRVRMLKTTVFNVDDFIDTQVSLATIGIPNKQVINAASGGKASTIYANAYLENIILDLTNTLQPALSSHVQSGKDGQGGAPASKNPTDAAQVTQDANSNNSDARV